MSANLRPLADSPSPVRWTPNLQLEDALGLFSDDELCVRHDVSLGELVAYRATSVYQAGVAAARKEIAEQGLTFKHKARLQAEHYLDNMVPRWLADPDAAMKDKTGLLAKLVEWGELEPKKEQAQQGGGFVFVVNMNGAQQALSVARPVIEHDATPAVTLGPVPAHINLDLGGGE